MSMMSSLIERLRQLVVGSNTWNYCVLWKLSEDQRFLEFVECCCGGSDHMQSEGGNGEEELIMFPPCRDVMFQHLRTTSCEALAQLPSSHPLDGINMEILISNHPKWLNFSNVSDLDIMNQVIVGTKVLIPIPGGLAELFAAKQVNEDQNIIDYVMEQCATLMEQEAMNNCNTGTVGISFSGNGFEELMNNNNNNNNWSSNNTVDHMHVMENSTNELQQQCGSETALKGSSADALVSDSDHLDELDEIDPKCRRKLVKGQQSKNLVAERKRRKKLNERLYHLRSLVPNISKLDRAAILGDAIKYVQDLQKEQNDLQNELERNSDDEANNADVILTSNFSSEISNPAMGFGFGPDYDHHMGGGGGGGGSDHLKRNNSPNHEKAQQMEVQVEVAQLDGNDNFFVKVFGEQKKGGFVRLMEALNCLGLEITNVNMTSCISLVSYVFIVKKRDHSEMVQAEYLRDSLLEATRNQAAGLICMAKVSSSTNGNGIRIGIDHLQHQHHQNYQHQSHLHHVHTDHINPLHNHFHHLS